MMEHLAGRPVSASTYSNHGCRCDGCRKATWAARRDYQARWRWARGALPMAEYLARVTKPHGTRGKYVHGCRCPECTRAERDYRRLVRMRTDLPCECSICPATFRTVRGLNHHEHTVHKET